MELSEKIELISETCRCLADLLKDPTKGGSESLTSEQRTELREEVHGELILCIDTLAAAAEFHSGISEIVNIAAKRLGNSKLDA